MLRLLEVLDLCRKCMQEFSQVTRLHRKNKQTRPFINSSCVVVCVKLSSLKRDLTLFIQHTVSYPTGTPNVGQDQ
jgi:heterodisulfide reductase subunit B